MTTQLFAQGNHVKSEFELCKANVLNRYRTKALNRDDALAEIQKCSGAGENNLYKECKKEQLGNKKLAKENCRRFLPAITVDPTSQMPFIVKGDRGFFAGVDFNKSYSFAELKLKNFECSKINTATEKSFAHTDFLLFGQDPTLFSRSLSIPKPLPKLSPKGLTIDTRAKIFSDASGPLLLFTLLDCSYKAHLEPPLQSMTLSFLVNLKKQLAVPYFGTVYFKKSDLKTVPYSLDVLRTLGLPFKTLARKSSGAIYLGTKNFKKYDSEGDPRDVCTESPPDPFIILLKSQKNLQTVQFVSFISVKNLCKFEEPSQVIKD